jgi:hypothetical protein
MKQYECGRTQPLLRTGMGHDRGKTSGRNLKGEDKILIIIIVPLTELSATLSYAQFA